MAGSLMAYLSNDVLSEADGLFGQCECLTCIFFAEQIPGCQFPCFIPIICLDMHIESPKKAR